MTPIFKETQRFNQWWLWSILLGIGCLATFPIYKQLLLNETFGDKPMSNSGIVIFALVAYGFIALFWSIRLQTEISLVGIHFTFSPFIRKTMEWDQIIHAEVLDYGFVGGWGIRWFTAYGTVYNIKGRKGLALHLKTGKK